MRLGILMQCASACDEIAAALGDPIGVAPDRTECLQDDLWSSLHTLRREQPAFEAWLNVTNVTMVDPSGFNRTFLLEDIDTIVKALDIKKDLAGDLAEVESNIRNKNELKAVGLVQATLHRDDLDLRLLLIIVSSYLGLFMRFRRESAQVLLDHGFRADWTRTDLNESRGSRSYGYDTGQGKSLM
jgi:hypothetical protein